jgi:mannose-6-phosphate isomerase-like protein (cupin superfamily)
MSAGETPESRPSSRSPGADPNGETAGAEPVAAEPVGHVDQRPWGHYVILADEPGHKVKRLVVLPGKRLSLQRHRRRSEHWFVIEGELTVTRDGQELDLRASNSVDIPAGTAHRVHNRGSEPAAFIEVQVGDYFGEDDIERLEDDYGRI